MEKSIIFVVEGKPVPLPRVKQGKYGFYDPSYQAKKNFALEIKEQITDNFEVIKSAVTLKITFYMPIPESLSNKKKLALNGQPYLKKKDTSNMLKFTEDALNEIVWEDDCLIWDVRARKIYSDNPRTVFEVIYDV